MEEKGCAAAALHNRSHTARLRLVVLILPGRDQRGHQAGKETGAPRVTDRRDASREISYCRSSIVFLAIEYDGSPSQLDDRGSERCPRSGCLVSNSRAFHQARRTRIREPSEARATPKRAQRRPDPQRPPEPPARARGRATARLRGRRRPPPPEPRGVRLRQRTHPLPLYLASWNPGRGLGRALRSFSLPRPLHNQRRVVSPRSP